MVPFICLSAGAIEWQSCCFATILLLYAPKKVILVLVLYISYLWRFFLLHYYIGRLSQSSLAASAVFPVAFIFLYSLCCNMLSANDSEVVDCGHEHTLQWPSIFLQDSSDHQCCGEGPPVPKLGIINQSTACTLQEDVTNIKP